MYVFLKHDFKQIVLSFTIFVWGHSGLVVTYNNDYSFTNEVGAVLCNQSLSPLNLWVWTPFMARCTRYNSELLQVGGFSLLSSTNKTDRQNITEILLKVALSTIKPNQANHRSHCWKIFFSIQFLFVLNVVFINIKTTISSISFIS